MSEEEKKKYESFKYYYETNTEKGISYMPDYLCKNVLNLTENLIAENKELKEIVETLRKENVEAMIQRRQYELHYIPKSKVEGLIKEINIEIQCCEYADDDIEEYKKDMEKEKLRLLRDKKVFAIPSRKGVEMEDNYIKPIGETLQDKISWLQKELFKEKERNENSISISLIEKKIEELREKVDGDDYWKYTEKDYLGMQYQIEILQELLDERNNTDV